MAALALCGIRGCLLARIVGQKVLASMGQKAFAYLFKFVHFSLLHR
jgi:hypothetical protein